MEPSPPDLAFWRDRDWYTVWEAAWLACGHEPPDRSTKPGPRVTRVYQELMTKAEHVRGRDAPEPTLPSSMLVRPQDAMRLRLEGVQLATEADQLFFWREELQRVYREAGKSPPPFLEDGEGSAGGSPRPVTEEARERYQQALAAMALAFATIAGSEYQRRGSTNFRAVAGAVEKACARKDIDQKGFGPEWMRKELAAGAKLLGLPRDD